MNDLIEALTILGKYIDPESTNWRNPTHCEHDIMLVMCDREDLLPHDAKRLDELGFFFSGEYHTWASFRFGIA
jgi:hypothetical protein